MQSKLALFATAALITLGAGCSKTPRAEQPAAKSIEHYRAHLTDAQEQVNACMAMRDKELSVMGPAEREAWKNTPAGINCNNAAVVMMEAKNAAEQQALRESSARFNTGYAK